MLPPDADAPGPSSRPSLLLERSPCDSPTRQVYRRVCPGGRTPKALYELLARGASYQSSLRWSDVYFFFGDERHVPPDHLDSNFRMANEALFKPASVPLENVFRVPTELADADEAALPLPANNDQLLFAGSGA